MTDLYRIEVEGAGPRARDFTRAQRRLADQINAEFRTLGARMDRLFKRAAPLDRGIVRDRVHAFVAFTAARPTITVRTFAVDPESRYPYLRVTRFGHRKLVIYPKRKWSQSTTKSGKPRRAMLKVHLWGHRNPHKFVYLPYVEGYHPTVDWTVPPAQASERLVDESVERLGRRIVRMV